MKLKILLILYLNCGPNVKYRAQMPEHSFTSVQRERTDS